MLIRATSKKMNDVYAEEYIILLKKKLTIEKTILR